MNWWLVLLLVCAPGQIPGRDAPRTYEFQLRKGEPQYGFLKSEDDAQVVVILDDPSLAPGTTTIIKKSDLVMKAAETPQEREARIDALLNARNMVRVVLPDGRWLPVAKAQYALSQRAREMAESVGEPAAGRPQPAAERAWRLQPASDSGPGRRPRRYVAAGVLVLGACALATVILRKMVFA